MLTIEPLVLDVYFRKLVARTTTLSERLNHTVIPSDSNLDDPKIQSLLDFWCQVIAKGDTTKFQRRLASDGFQRQTLPTLI
jgi:hypothetical protein